MKKAKILGFIGFIMLLAAWGILFYESKKPAKASTTTDYSVTYTVTQCHYLDGYIIYLGPAEWRVDTDLGRDGSIDGSETWTVTTWKETSATYTNTSINDVPCSSYSYYGTNPADGFPFQFNTAGLYGYLKYYLVPGEIVWKIDTGFSMPTAWRITGSITTP